MNYTAIVALFALLMFFTIYNLKTKEHFDSVLMTSNGWTQYIKPNYYGRGSWGYQYGDPFYYRKGEHLAYED